MCVFREDVVSLLDVLEGNERNDPCIDLLQEDSDVGEGRKVEGYNPYSGDNGMAAKEGEHKAPAELALGPSSLSCQISNLPSVKMSLGSLDMS